MDNDVETRYDLGNGLIPFLKLLNIEGKPYTLNNHFMLAPMYKAAKPRRTVWKTARQVGKSVGIATQGVIQGALYDYFHQLFIHPRFDQSQDFSNYRMRPLLAESPFLKTCMEGGTDAIFTKTFPNSSGSRIHMNYAFLSADRVRGQSGISKCYLDEVQDIEHDHIGVIGETMSAVVGDRGFYEFTGTAKTTNCTLEVLWRDSSMAEWVVPCAKCRKLNVPSLAQDLLKMIGKETVVCAKCQLPLDPATGWWEHAAPAVRGSFEGYHVSQVIHPLHYKYPSKWAEFLYKMEHYGKGKAYNELLGESWDENTCLLTPADLFGASTDRENSLSYLLSQRNRYTDLYMGVDWSGKGSDGVSTTAVAIVGIRAGTDTVDCLFMERLPAHMGEADEVRAVIEYAHAARVSWLAHDFTGAGSLREVLMLQMGFQEDMLAPFTYVCSPNKQVITYNNDTDKQRKSWSIDKARSLVIMASMLKAKKITLPSLEDEKTFNTASDLLSLMEETREMPRGSSLRVVVKAAKKRDDAAHALNLACSCAWHTAGDYPSLTEAERFRMPDLEGAEKGMRNLT